jgi:hypothetical protein
MADDRPGAGGRGIARTSANWRYKSRYTLSLGLIPCLTHALSTSYPAKNSPYNCARRECEPVGEDCEPRINTVGSGAMNVGRAHMPESIIVGREGCSIASRPLN